jgi:hypothetical protein
MCSLIVSIPDEFVTPFVLPGYKDRGKRRSKTSLGVAAAMAQQWGVLE